MFLFVIIIRAVDLISPLTKYVCLEIIAGNNPVFIHPVLCYSSGLTLVLCNSIAVESEDLLVKQGLHNLIKTLITMEIEKLSFKKMCISNKLHKFKIK